MPQTVGAILVQLQAKTEDLEKKLAAAEKRIERYRKVALSGSKALGEGARDGSRMFGSAMDKVGLKTEALKKSMRNVAAGALFASGSLDGVGKSAEVAADTFGAFLTGGPIAAGIVGLTGLLGLLAKNGAEEAAKQAEEAKKKYDDWFDGVVKGAEDAKKAVDALNAAVVAKQFDRVGINLPQDVIDKKNKGRDAYDAMMAQQAKYDALVKATNGSTYKEVLANEYRNGGHSARDSGHIVDRAQTKFNIIKKEGEALQKLKETYASLTEELEKLKKIRDIDKDSAHAEFVADAAAAAQKEADAIRASLPGLQAKTELERDIAEAIKEKNAAMATAAKAGFGTDEGKSLAGAANAQFAARINAAREAESKRYDADIKAARTAEQKFWDDLFDNMDKREEKERDAAKRSEQFVNDLTRQADVAEALSDDAQERAEWEGKVAEAIERGTLSLEDAAGAYAAIERILAGKAAERAKKEADARQEKATALREEFDATMDQAKVDLDYQNKLLAYIDDENGALAAQHEKETALLEVRKKMAALRDKAKKVGGISEAEIVALEALEAAKIEGVYQRALTEGAKKAAKDPTVTTGLLESLGGTLSAGLADLIFDGIKTGFENAQDIALRIVDSMLQQILQEIAQSAVKSAFAGLFSGGGGGGGILSGIFSALTGAGGSSGVGTVGGSDLAGIASGVAGIGGCDG